MNLLYRGFEFEWDFLFFSILDLHVYEKGIERKEALDDVFLNAPFDLLTQSRHLF